MSQPVSNEEYLSYKSTMERLQVIKKNLEINSMFKISKGTIQKLRMGHFSSPSASLLSSTSVLKSKSKQGGSVTSEETRDEDFPTSEPLNLNNKKMDMDLLFSSGIKKNIAKNSVQHTNKASHCIKNISKVVNGDLKRTSQDILIL